MKTLVLTAASILILGACNNVQQSNAEKKDSIVHQETASIGGDKDEHGCLVAAGQSWSEIKQSCIQVFSIGTRLNPVNRKEGEAIISAFIVANDDRSKWELFLPNRDTTIILIKIEDGIYQKHNYKYDAKKADLYIDAKITYKGNVE